MSVDALLVQPYSAGLVELLHVLKVPGGKELEQRAEVNSLVAVDLFKSGTEFSQQVVVGSLMFLEAGKALLVQKLLFALEVHLGEFDKALELKANVTPVATVDEHGAQVIQGIHQDPVLIVHGLDADDALVTPRQQGHKHLRNKSESSPAAGTLNGAMVVLP